MSNGIKLMTIIFICIIIVSLIFLSSLTEGFADQHMFPFVSPFKTDFFASKKKVAKVAVNGEFGARIAALFAPSENCHISNDEHKILMQVNAHESDFTVVLEDLLFDAVNGIGFPEKLKNLRLVATLFSGYVSVLCPDDLPLYDFMDADSSKLGRRVRISVGPSGSPHHTSCLKIARYLGMVNSFEFIFESDVDKIVRMWKNHEIDLIYQISEHPSMVIRRASDAMHSHLLSIRSLNNGNIYGYTLDEQEFYDAFNTYHKSLHDLDLLVPRIYPNLTLIDRRSLYLPTISSRYSLVCHDRVADENVQNVLVNIITYLKQEVGKKKYFLKDITEATLSYSRTPIDFHRAAAQVYRNMNLISNSGKDTDHCVFYAHGQCPSKSESNAIFKEKVNQKRLVTSSPAEYANKFATEFNRSITM